MLIKGYDDFLVRFAGWCNPVPGDRIIGFISRGRGICVHRADCPNMRNEDPVRLVEAEGANDSPSLIANVTATIANMQLNITSFNARVDKRGKAILNVTVQIPKVESIDELTKKLLANKQITDVFRSTT